MTMREIHPHAVVAASAKLGEGVRVGACAVVGEDVELGEGCVLHAHAVVGGPSKFGKNNVFHSFCAIRSMRTDCLRHSLAIRLQQRSAAAFSRLGDSARTNRRSVASICGRRGFRRRRNSTGRGDSAMVRTC